MTDIPPQFDHPPTIQVIEKRMTSAEIIAVCNKGPNVLACSSVPHKPWLACTQFLPIVGPGGVGPAMGALLKRWENARCNGWLDKTATVY